MTFAGRQLTVLPGERIIIIIIIIIILYIYICINMPDVFLKSYNIEHTFPSFFKKY